MNHACSPALFLPALVAIAALLPASLIAQKRPQVRVNTDHPGAAHSLRPQIAAPGDSVYLTWYDDRNASGVFDIFFNGSLDGGASWLPSDIKLDSDPGSSQRPQIAASGEFVYVTWYDDRDGKSDIYFNRSLDGGASWLTSETRLNTNLPGVADSVQPQIAASGEFVYVTWSDDRNGTFDIYFNRSLDGGTTWLPSDIRLDTDPHQAEDARVPQIAASNDSVFVTWFSERNGFFDINFNRSLDGGASWLPFDIELNTSSGSSQYPQIAASGDSVYVTWHNARNDTLDVYFNRSLDGGANWLPSDIRLDTHSQSGLSALPQIAASGDSVYVTWYDDRPFGNTKIYFNRSLDGGASWLNSDIRLDTAREAAPIDPRIAASGDSVYVAWETGRGQPWGDIYFNRSLDGGTTWLPSDIRLDRDLPVGGTAASTQIAASGDSVYVTWSELRISDGDIYFNIPFGAQPYGEGAAGSGGFTPVLHGTDSLTLGNTFTLSARDGLGGTIGVLILGGPGSKASIPFAGGSLLIDPIEAALPIRLKGAAGVAGAGSNFREIRIPEIPALLGFNLNFQAGFFDPAAVQSVSLSNAVEAWIL